MMVPSGDGFVESIIIAEVLRLGGSLNDARRLIRDRSFVIDFTEQKHEDLFIKFWRDTIMWIIKHRDAINDEQSVMILGWAQHCYTEGSLLRQQAFSWKRRSPRAVIEASRAYYEQIHHGYRNPSIHLRWSSHGWDWDYIADDEQNWKFRELTSGLELFDEGSAMKHCVGGYYEYCISNRSAIFSVSCNGARAITLELASDSRQIPQARGKYNQSPTSSQQQIIELWLQYVESMEASRR